MQKLYKLHACLWGSLSRTPANKLVYTWQPEGSDRYQSFSCYNKYTMMAAFIEGTKFKFQTCELDEYLKSCKECKLPTFHPAAVRSEK